MPNPDPRNQESIREEQVQNGVKFLSHPRVKGSPVTYRRSFLETKGLTTKEIDEAFRRVPDDTPTQTAIANQGGRQSQPISNIQGQVPTQYQQPVAASRRSKLGTLTASWFHWSHALLAVGVLAISGAGTAVLIKNAVVPRFKSWIHKVAHEDGEEDLAKKINTKPRLVEEAAASAAKTVASYVAHASQGMVSKTEEKRYFGELKSLLGMQVEETKSMSNSIKKLEENKHFEELKSLLSMQVEEMKSMSNSIKKLEERSLSPRPYPKTYMEVVAMAQRGEIALQGPPQPKPWEVPVQRPWVPPEPPRLAMAEAAAAIMRPKKRPFVEEQQWPDEQFVADVTDELQSVTKLSESGGVSDIDGGSQVVTTTTTTNTSEIHEEDDRWYYEP